MKIQSDCSHNIEGLLWFNFPVGIILTFIFHNIVKVALVNNSPNFIYRRMIAFNEFNWNNYFKKNWLIVIISIIIGALSHLFWDSFTHIHGYFVENLDIYKNNYSVAGKEIPLYKIMQHSSTLIGGLIILIAFVRLPKMDLKNEISPRYWLTFAIVAVAIISIRCFFGLHISEYGNVVVTLISSSIMAAIITPLTYRASKKCW